MSIRGIAFPAAIMMLLCCSAMAQKPMDRRKLANLHVDYVATHVTMAQAVAALQKSIGLGILVDDRPIREFADVAVHGNASDALNRLCGLFDYSWRQVDPHMIVMTKAFHDPAEGPQTDAREIEHMANRMLTVLAGIRSSYNGGPSVSADLLSSLTNDQQTLLTAGGNLQFDRLLPNQQSLIKGCLAQMLDPGLTPSTADLRDAMSWLDRSWAQVTDATGTVKIDGVPIVVRFPDIEWHWLSEGSEARTVNLVYISGQAANRAAARVHKARKAVQR